MPLGLRGDGPRGAGVGRLERLERPAAVRELDREHAGHQDQRDRRQAGGAEQPVHGVVRRRGAITVSRARSARPAPTRNESRKARVAARSSWASRSRSSCGRGGTRARARGRRREGAVQVGDLTLLVRQLVAERSSDRDLVLRLQRGVEHQGRDRLLGGRLGVLQVRGEDRRQDRQSRGPRRCGER